MTANKRTDPTWALCFYFSFDKKSPLICRNSGVIRKSCSFTQAQRLYFFAQIVSKDSHKMKPAQTVLFGISSWSAALVYEPPVDHLCCNVLSEKSLSCHQFAREGSSGRMSPCPWSSPGNLLLMLPDMVIWHLQQVVPRRSGHSVSVTPLWSKYHVTGQCSPPQKHQEVNSWPFLFRTDLILHIAKQYQFALHRCWNWQHSKTSHKNVYKFSEYDLYLIVITQHFFRKSHTTLESTGLQIKSQPVGEP